MSIENNFETPINKTSKIILKKVILSIIMILVLAITTLFIEVQVKLNFWNPPSLSLTHHDEHYLASNRVYNWNKIHADLPAIEELAKKMQPISLYKSENILIKFRDFKPSKIQVRIWDHGIPFPQDIEGNSIKVMNTAGTYTYEVWAQWDKNHIVGYLFTVKVE